ncbi:hypothetical protein P7F60_10540 [Rhizobium sp. YJ-22]|uniref:hypothetical protein n=1 Tax=Rhizobium sp. YJ-22 TaxID=3037556 RepID=UPI002412A15B|nr:hypothetical protein [Rhizobium sp. YJ-22]MDG3576827.1 hypothetical protein [Rhizobium sp. YJ-22]
MRLLGGLNGFKVGELKAIAQRRDNRPGQRGAMLVKPKSGYRYPVGRGADFLSLFKSAFAGVGQGSRMIFKVARTTSLSAIFLPIA